MDLGKMLAEALSEGGDPLYPRSDNGCYVVDDTYDLQAVAQTFLAKVRAAQGVEVEVLFGHDDSGALVPMKRPLSSKAGNEALAFYADPKNWIATGWQGDMDPAPCVRDGGAKAREALVPQPWVGEVISSVSDRVNPMQHRNEME